MKFLTSDTGLRRAAGRLPGPRRRRYRPLAAGGLGYDRCASRALGLLQVLRRVGYLCDVRAALLAPPPPPYLSRRCIDPRRVIIIIIIIILVGNNSARSDRRLHCTIHSVIFSPEYRPGQKHPALGFLLLSTISGTG